MQYQAVWNAIMQAKKQHVVAHAYLLYGDQLVALEDFAQKAISYLQCNQAGEDGSVCGVCQYCLAHTAGYPLDVYVLRRAEGELSISIAQVRAFIADISKTTHGGRKIGLIVGADLLSTEAKEALLKTLEEPPGETTIIVLAQDRHQVPVTIRSRCQQWYCYSGEMEDAQRVLASQDWSILAGSSLYERMRWAYKVATDDDVIARVQNILRYGELLLAHPEYLESPHKRATIVRMLRSIAQALESLRESIGSRRLILEVCVLELTHI